jgi:amino-acid N-acetyltransferase
MHAAGGSQYQCSCASQEQRGFRKPARLVLSAPHVARERDGPVKSQIGARAAQSMALTSITARPCRAAVAALLDASDLPSADLTDAHMEHFFFCGPAVAPTALVGVEPCGSSALLRSLLRSLVVRPEHRSVGLGAALVEHAEAYARAGGARALYLLTTTAEPFFARLGYTIVERARAPREIAATREFAGICPASSVFMAKRL